MKCIKPLAILALLASSSSMAAGGASSGHRVISTDVTDALGVDPGCPQVQLPFGAAPIRIFKCEVY